MIALYRYMIKSITTSHSFEELRTTQYANTLQPLVTYLSDNVHHPATVHALLYSPLIFFRGPSIY